MHERTEYSAARGCGLCLSIGVELCPHSGGQYCRPNNIYVQITVFNTCTLEQKKAFFRRTAELLGENPGIRPEDVFVNIIESAKENWSVGNGIAQFA